MIILSVLQIIVAVLLIGSILLQMQGAGLGSTYGGSGDFYRSKRSVEKLLVYATSILGAIFAIISIALVFPH